MTSFIRHLFTSARPSRLVLVGILLLSASTALTPAQPAPASAAQMSTSARHAYKLVGGRWFDGRVFQERTVFVVDGMFMGEALEGAVTIDLAGGFVVPPFGEAHNHNIEGPDNLASQAADYLRDGIFYVKIQNAIRERADSIRSLVNQPQTIDVSFAHGALTSTGGHPARLYQEVLRERVYRNIEKQWFVGRAYFEIDRLEDFERQWDAIRSSPPDFIKVVLWYSEEFEKRRNDPEMFGRRGLDPRLLPHIVSRARAAGLRVSAHVETATDFHHAVMAGVDEINHLPGCNPSPSRPDSDFEIAAADAAQAARAGTVVVTTAILAPRRAQGDAALLTRIQALERRNLQLLHERGVALAIGSDRTEMTSLPEAMYLHALKVFDNATLLSLWSDVTARAIFPSRRIGRLEPGYEASFLVLDGNPLENFQHVRRIRLRYKQGKRLELATTAAPTTPTDVKKPQ